LAAVGDVNAAKPMSRIATVKGALMAIFMAIVCPVRDPRR
jgi:hypothetical protein